MRLQRVTTAIALIAACGIADAGPPRACAEVSDRVEGAVAALLENARPAEAGDRVRAQLPDCLTSRNICSVSSTPSGKDAVVAGDVTSDLPAQGLEQGESSVLFLVRSIPQVPQDSNRYCLVSEKSSDTTAVHRWSVYGWVIAPGAGEALPLPRQVLDADAASDPHTLRSLAAALWFFAQWMSGHPPPEAASGDSARAAGGAPHRSGHGGNGQSLSSHVWPSRSLPNE